MIYVIYDTNVIVSAFLKFESVPHKVVKLIFSKSIKLIYTNDIYREYQEVLNRTKFNFKKCDIDDFLKASSLVGEKIDTNDIEVELIDKGDIPFYKAFLKKKMSENLVFLVTGNKKAFSYKSIILSPREFYELIENVRYLGNLC